MYVQTKQQFLSPCEGWYCTILGRMTHSCCGGKASTSKSMQPLSLWLSCIIHSFFFFFLFFLIPTSGPFYSGMTGKHGCCGNVRCWLLHKVTSACAAIIVMGTPTHKHTHIKRQHPGELGAFHMSGHSETTFGNWRLGFSQVQLQIGLILPVV